MGRIMNPSIDLKSERNDGSALAALVAAGAGCACMGVLYVAATISPAVGRTLTWYAPSGALSGMSGLTIFVWLLVWMILHRAWVAREIGARTAILVASLLLVLGLLLTFPPIARLFNLKFFAKFSPHTTERL